MYKNAAVKVYCGDKLIYESKKPKFAPGEMQCITLKAALFENAEQIKFGLEVM